MFMNQSIQMLNFVWNEKRFVESKSARKAARRCLIRATNIQLGSELKNLESQNEEIRREISRCNHDLHKYDEKLQVLDNMTQLATQSLEVYFQARMENLRTFVSEQCRVISDGIQEESEHWKEIYAMLQQKLVVPGDLRSYGGGNGLPRGVKQSPNFSRIMEEEEELEQTQQQEFDDAEDDGENNVVEKKGDVSIFLQGRTLTPLITQTLKKARLRASRRPNDNSFMSSRQLDMSTTMTEETLVEESEPSAKSSEVNHVTLRDVSAIEKEAEMEIDIPQEDLSVSLLPFVPSTNNDENEKILNKSTSSTISDRTFVKTSLKPIISEDEEDEEDDENGGNNTTLMEESIVFDNTEKARPLLLTADQSIRMPNKQSIKKEKLSLPVEQIKIKQEKRSFHQAMETNDYPEKQRSGRAFLSSKPTFNAEKSDFVRPTIIVTNENSRLSPIASEESDEEKEEISPKNFSHRKTENKSAEEILSTSNATRRSKAAKSPVVTQLPPPAPTTNAEPNGKRRTNRRTTIRLLQENQNLQQTAETTAKTRYPTRFSTRLAAGAVSEEISITTNHRRTSRFTSE